MQSMKEMRMVVTHSQEVSLQGTRVADRQLQTSPDNDFTEVLSSDTPKSEKTQPTQQTRNEPKRRQRQFLATRISLFASCNSNEVEPEVANPLQISRFAQGQNMNPTRRGRSFFHYHEIMTQDITLAMEPFVDRAKIFGVVEQPL